ncbi:MAG: nucleotidyltransferase domain-containing protein [Thermoguttaceae bacterium]|nr:nucleotidyltransferase domain-containing protein [Thermoguttaceae bacterium]
MKYDLPEHVEREIIKYAEIHGIQKVILFGSRARGTNRERSDVDIAVSGGNIRDFRFDLEEEAQTLLMFDVVDLDHHISVELQKEIERDGVVIYEKI